jgi:hypothetical protein
MPLTAPHRCKTRSQSPRAGLAWALALALGLPTAAGAQEPTAAYEVSLWARVLFGVEGRPVDIEIIDQPGLSAQFIRGARARIERARIEPRQLNGSPAELRTGVRMGFEVTPGPQGASVKVLGLEMLPLPLKQPHAAYPPDLARAESWAGTLTASCTVSVAGRCKSASVRSRVVMPESARRFVKDSLELWVFEPQELAGQAIEGEFATDFHLRAQAVAPEDFRMDKFERVIKGR